MYLFCFFSMAESQLMIFCSISDLKGVDFFRLDEAAKEDEAMVLVDMKGREVGKDISNFLVFCPFCSQDCWEMGKYVEIDFISF